MQKIETNSGTVESAAGGMPPHPLTGSTRGRVQAIAESLSYGGRKGETVSELAHDARSMVMALMLYCDLLEEPGVLSLPCRHYADELRLVAASCRRLVEKLSLLGKRETVIPTHSSTRPATHPVALSLELPEQPIENLRQELLAMRNLLSALAGPAVAVTVAAQEGALPVWLTAEDLTRVLVNLVKNASAAITGAGIIHITLRQQPASADAPASLLIVVEDSGPGMNPAHFEAVFEPGFTTNAQPDSAYRGLGLFICRSILQAAGGKIFAGNRSHGGARFVLELPVRTQ